MCWRDGHVSADRGWSHRICEALRWRPSGLRAWACEKLRRLITAISDTWKNYWLGAAITLCAEVSAASIVIDFWNVKINPALWITVVLASVLALNIFSVRGYGEAVSATIKLFVS